MSCRSASRGREAHVEELVRRFDRAPKPMYYQPDFLEREWAAYLAEHDVAPKAVDPDAFVRWTYRRALARREPIYRAMARELGRQRRGRRRRTSPQCE